MSATQHAGYFIWHGPRPGSVPPPPLRITAGALAAALVSSWGEYPDAAHGLMGARDGHLVQSLLHSVRAVPRTACIAQVPDDQRARALQRAGRDITVGATFHVHLARPATPTEHDREQLLAPPHLPLLIVSLQDVDAPDIRAWQLHDNDTVEVPLQLTHPDLYPPPEPC